MDVHYLYLQRCLARSLKQAQSIKFARCALTVRNHSRNSLSSSKEIDTCTTSMALVSVVSKYFLCLFTLGCDQFHRIRKNQCVQRGLKQGWVSTRRGACGSNLAIKRWTSKLSNGKHSFEMLLKLTRK